MSPTSLPLGYCFTSPLQITSGRDLENEFSAMLKPFEVRILGSIHIWLSLSVIFLQGKETEHNWAAREQAILRVRGMLKGDVHLRYMDIFLACLKEGFIQWSLKTVSLPRADVGL